MVWVYPRGVASAARLRSGYAWSPMNLVSRPAASWGSALGFALMAAMALLGADGGCRCRDADYAGPPPPKPTARSAPVSVSLPVLRPARLAGTWYQDDPAQLRAQLDGDLAAAARAPVPRTKSGQRLFGLIVPHAGYRYSAATAAYAYRLIAQAKVAPTRIFVLGPSHRRALRGIAPVEAQRFGTPLGALTIDTAAEQQLWQHAIFVHDREADAREHSVEMQMPWLRRVAPHARVVPLVVGQLTFDEVQQAADAIGALLGPGDLVLASSDFTHYGPQYGYQPFRDKVSTRLRQLDMQAFGRIAAADIASFWRFKHATQDTICGFYPISVLMALASRGLSAQLLHYDTSSSVTGDPTNSVSYLAIAVYAPNRARWKTSSSRLLTPTEQQDMLHIARASIAHVLHGNEGHFDPASLHVNLSGHLALRRGLFVTLKLPQGGRDQLRGCIGTLEASAPIGQEVAVYAQHAAFRDSRFAPLRAEELPRVVLEVTLLTDPVPVSGSDAVTIGRDGIVLERGGRRAVFLPQVAVEQGWGREQTLRALAYKAGLEPDAWRHARLETFQGEVYDERHLSPLPR